MTLYDAQHEPWWCQCQACNTTGDIVNVAMHVWKVDSHHPRIRALCRGIWDPAISADRRAQVESFWSRCHDRHDGASAIYTRYGLVGASQTAYTQFATRVRIIDGQAVKAVLSDKTLTCDRPFKAKRSDLFLVSQIFDLPGRVCGYVLTSPHSTYRLTYRHAASDGYYGRLDQIKQNEVILCDSPGRIARMYASEAREGIPCPVLGVLGLPDLLIAHHALPKNIICWSPDNPIHALRLAKHLGGRAAVCATSADDPLAAQLSIIRQAAIPWREACYRYIGMSDGAEHARFIFGQDWSTAERREFIEQAPEYAKRFLQEAAPQRHVETIQFDRKTIHETPNGWYETNGGLISDAAVELDTVQHDASGKAYYRGLIRFQGGEHRFTAPAAEIETRLLSWAQSYLRDIARVGVSRYNSRWNRHGMAIALAFRKPQVAEGGAGLGWDDKLQQFNTADYGLTVGGDVVELTCIDPGRARPLPRPTRLDHETVRLLSTPGETTEAAWAAMGALAANLLATPLRRPRPGILVLGESNWATFSTLFEHLGCPVWGSLPEWHIHPVWRNRDKIVGAHKWPGIVRTTWGRRWKTSFREWTCTQPGDVICQTDHDAAIGLMTQNDWVACAQSNVVGFTKPLRDAAAIALAGWLSDLCRRRLLLATIGDYPRAVLEDMAVWFEHNGGSPVVVRNANQWLLSSGRVSELLVRYVSEQRRFGGQGLGGIRLFDKPRGGALYAFEGGVLIPRELVNKIIRRARMPVELCHPAITESMAANGSGRETEIDGHVGWLLKHSAWSNVRLASCQPLKAQD